MITVGGFILYVVIALVIVVCSILAVTTRKILRAATFLLFTLFATAAAYFQLDYEFLGAVQIAVYAGGIVVLFVFAIFLTGRPGEDSEVLVSRKRLIALISAIALFAVAGWSLIQHFFHISKFPLMPSLTMKTLGETLMGTGYGEYLLPFEAISVLLLACIIGGIVIARKK